ncbi:hypothetical protein H4Q32_021467 [Labeo rohita]|uniref:Uncharacterized protein n=1 Tax=Labeo rohita TaxID=84645 RepID=A0ABQ8MQY1_LABRO|nr:hypothetical protein H4Q32_021467 [Labeo rohita]
MMKKKRAAEEKEHLEDIATNKKILEVVNKLADRFDIQEKRVEDLSRKMEENSSLITWKRREDLSKEDKMARELLWPKIKEARDQKKRAYFRGPFGFIENVQIFP